MLVGQLFAGMFPLPLRYLVGHLGDPRADDELQPGVLEVFEVLLAHHPGIGDHGHLR